MPAKLIYQCISLEEQTLRRQWHTNHDCCNSNSSHCMHLVPMSTSPTCSRQLKLIQLVLQQNHAEAAWKRSLNQSKVNHEVTLLYSLYPHNQCTYSNLHAPANAYQSRIEACVYHCSWYKLTWPRSISRHQGSLVDCTKAFDNSLAPRCSKKGSLVT